MTLAAKKLGLTPNFRWTPSTLFTEWTRLLLERDVRTPDRSSGSYVPDNLCRPPSLFKVVAGASYRTRPQPTAVLQGQTVTLSCAFDGLADDDVVIWEGGPDHQTIAFGRTVLKVYRRHRITGDASRGEYNLEITGVKLEDDGKYSCYTDPKSAADAILTVAVPMTGPPAVTGGELPVTSGDQLSLTCRASGGHPAPRLTWLNGTHRFRDASVSTEAQSLELFLPRVTKWDHGANFTCRADQGFPQLARLKASSRILRVKCETLVFIQIQKLECENSRILRVKYPPAVSVPSPSVHVREGEPASLSCMVDSNPKATVTWRKVGGAIPILKMMSQVGKTLSDQDELHRLWRDHVGIWPRYAGRGAPANRDHVLHLPKVSRHDGGLYHCDANNGVLPKGTGTVTLLVYYPPVIEATTEDQVTILYGQEDRYEMLFCPPDRPSCDRGYHGGPDPPVIEATMEDQVTMLYGQKDRYEMLFCSPDRPSCDRGYHGGPDPPVIEATMEDQVTMLYGQDDQSLQCLADGNPKPHIRWRRKDTSLYWDNPLRFHRVRYDVQGTYQCVAASDGFQEVTKDVYVDVVGKPSIQRGQPAVTVAAGNTARFHCEILADPLPGRVSWFRQSLRRRGEETVVMATEVGVSITENPVDDGISSTLLLKDVGKSQQGMYICQAANMFGEARREIRLQVFDNSGSLVIICVSMTTAGLGILAGILVCVAVKKRWICREEKRAPPPLPSGRSLAAVSSGRSVSAVPKPGKRLGHGTNDSGVEDLELQELDGTLKPRPPPRGDKQWTNVGLSYSELAHAHATTLPPYTTVERHRPDGEDIRACAREDIPEEAIVPDTACLPRVLYYENFPELCEEIRDMGVPTPPPKAAKGKRHVRAPSGETPGMPACVRLRVC
ncbi:hypothetical protein Bbelb_309840 [Branchiostoma belcheri]|nr:hypothetical protein Bbelb_309840 [Branchiostoma belcheri]